MPRQSFDDLISWRAARALAAAVHRATAGAPFQADAELRAELRAAAMAVMTAVAEGYEQRTYLEFERKLVVACGAAARLESLICLAADMNCLNRDAALRLRARASYAASLIEALRQAVTRYQRLSALPAPARVN
jgi:four helix bundle protein